MNDESVSALLDVTLNERELRSAALDALDQKAGVILAADGLVITFAATLGTMWARGLVVAFFIISAFYAARALRVRQFKALRVVTMRNKYIAKDGQTTRRRLLDTLITDFPQIERDVQSKADKVKIAFVWMVIGVAVLAVLVTVIGS